MKKNRRKYKDGDKVVVGGYEFVVKSYHYPSKSYGLHRSDGLFVIATEDEFDTIFIPPIRPVKE